MTAVPEGVPPEPGDLTVIRFSLSEFIVRSDSEAETWDRQARWFLCGWPSANTVPGMRWEKVYRDYLIHHETIVYPGESIFLMMHGKRLTRDGTEY